MYDVSYKEEYEHMNQTILHGNVMNTSLIITEGSYDDIYADDSTCHGYYIIILMVKLFLPVKWYVKDLFFSININYRYYYCKINKPNEKIIHI